MSVFKNPKMVKEQLDLPSVLNYSFVGETSNKYHACVDEIVTRVVGKENIRRRTFKESSKGNYTAYKYEIYHTKFEDVEMIYKEVMSLEGTKFVI